ncbi:MAG: hypothetical protein AAF802_22475, partial [Planctomycetota bacterium]
MVSRECDAPAELHVFTPQLVTQVIGGGERANRLECVALLIAVISTESCLQLTRCPSILGTTRLQDNLRKASAMPSTRRNFLTGVATIGVITTRSSRAFGFKNANDRPRIAVVGCGSRWDQRATLANGPYGVGKEFPKFGDIVAVC